MTVSTSIPNKNFTQAEIIELAEKGEAWAQNWLGVQYLNGKSIPEDPATGFIWIHKAALQGDRNAQSNLGECYLEGEGTNQNVAEAELWFQRAADQGQAVAQSSLGFLCDQRKDFENARYWYRRSARQGFGIAQNNLAVLYHAGSGVPTNLIEAYKWYSLAASQDIENSIDMIPELTKDMTRAQIAEAQRRAAEFSPKEERVIQEEEPTALEKLILRCGGDLTLLIERFEAFEDRLKVRLDALKVEIGKSTDGYEGVWVSGELHPYDGVVITEDIQLVFDVIDEKGRISNKNSYGILHENFFGFESFIVMIPCASNTVSKIRIYPKKYASSAKSMG